MYLLFWFWGSAQKKPGKVAIIQETALPRVEDDGIALGSLTPLISSVFFWVVTMV